MNVVEVLTRYKAWADDVFLSAVASAPPAELTAPRPIVFGSLIRTLHHSYAMDHVWHCHLLEALQVLKAALPPEDFQRLILDQPWPGPPPGPPDRV